MHYPGDLNNSFDMSLSDRPVNEHSHDRPLDEDEFIQTKATLYPEKTYNGYVYGSHAAAEKKLKQEFERHAFLRPMKHRASRCLKQFRQRQLFISAFQSVDIERFPWVLQSIKADTSHYKIGDGVESAEFGEVGECCTITEFYPSKLTSINASTN